MPSAANAVDIDPVEQHPELRRVELDARCARLDAGQAKTRALETFVIDDESAAVPEKDFDPVSAPPNERKEVAGERIHAPLIAHDRVETVVTHT